MISKRNSRHFQNCRRHRQAVIMIGIEISRVCTNGAESAPPMRKPSGSGCQHPSRESKKFGSIFVDPVRLFMNELRRMPKSSLSPSAERAERRQAPEINPEHLSIERRHPRRAGAFCTLKRSPSITTGVPILCKILTKIKSGCILSRGKSSKRERAAYGRCSSQGKRRTHVGLDRQRGCAHFLIGWNTKVVVPAVELFRRRVTIF